MRKRLLILLAAGAVFATTVALIVGMSQGSEKPRPDSTPASSATPSASPGAVKVYEEDVQDFEAENPVAAHVPKQTPYWRLELTGLGKRKGKLVIQATVYVKPGQNEQAAIRKQRPFMERWLASVGQKPDTYVLQMTTEPPHVY